MGVFSGSLYLPNLVQRSLVCLHLLQVLEGTRSCQWADSGSCKWLLRAIASTSVVVEDSGLPAGPM